MAAPRDLATDRPGSGNHESEWPLDAGDGTPRARGFRGAGSGRNDRDRRPARRGLPGDQRGVGHQGRLAEGSAVRVGPACPPHAPWCGRPGSTHRVRQPGQPLSRPEPREIERVRGEIGRWLGEGAPGAAASHGGIGGLGRRRRPGDPPHTPGLRHATEPPGTALPLHRRCRYRLSGCALRTPGLHAHGGALQPAPGLLAVQAGAPECALRRRVGQRDRPTRPADPGVAGDRGDRPHHRLPLRRGALDPELPGADQRSAGIRHPEHSHVQRGAAQGAIRGSSSGPGVLR